jgi:DNA-binding MarR family transcriptional regulator
VDETDIAELQSHLRRLHKRSMRSVPPLEGVSRTAARVLRVVARAGGDDGMRPGQIAEALGMTTSNVAAALRELEDAGYIARRRSAADARRIAVALTAHGSEVVAAHRALRVDGLREAVEGALTPGEQARLAAVIPLIGRVAAYESDVRTTDSEGSPED